MVRAWARTVLIGIVVLVLAVVPYVAPFADAQKVLPLLDTLRFPRFPVLVGPGIRRYQLARQYICGRGAVNIATVSTSTRRTGSARGPGRRTNRR
mgnify:CR=1 FL=1